MNDPVLHKAPTTKYGRQPEKLPFKLRFGSNLKEWNRLRRELQDEAFAKRYGMQTMQARIEMLRAVKRRVENLLQKDSMRDALSECKRYREPPWTVACCVIGIFLNMNIPGMLDWMRWEEELQVHTVPSEGHALVTIWARASKMINVKKILGCMMEFDPGEECLPDIDEMGFDRVALRSASLLWIINNVTSEMAEKSSRMAMLIREWIEVNLHLKDAYERLRELNSLS